MLQGWGAQKYDCSGHKYLPLCRYWFILSSPLPPFSQDHKFPNSFTHYDFHTAFTMLSLFHTNIPRNPTTRLDFTIIRRRAFLRAFLLLGFIKSAGSQPSSPTTCNINSENGLSSYAIIQHCQHVLHDAYVTSKTKSAPNIQGYKNKTDVSFKPYMISDHLIKVVILVIRVQRTENIKEYLQS